MADSFYLVIAITTFSLGIILFLVSISSTSWQGLDGGVTISLWKVCYRLNVGQSWICNSWHIAPDFVRLAQALCIISLMCCIVWIMLLICGSVLRCLHHSKLAIIVLSLLTFTSACMIVVAVIAMGWKGRGFLLELKEDDEKKFKFFPKGIIISGYSEIGWALILATVVSLINFSSFVFFLLEYNDMTDL